MKLENKTNSVYVSWWVHNKFHWEVFFDLYLKSKHYLEQFFIYLNYYYITEPKFLFWIVLSLGVNIGVVGKKKMQNTECILLSKTYKLQYQRYIDLQLLMTLIYLNIPKQQLQY